MTTLSRFTSTFCEPQFAPYARLIGQSTLLWNDLHDWLGVLYQCALGGSSAAHLAAWQALKVDRSKREILLAAVSVLYQHPLRGTARQRGIYEAFKWLCDRCDGIEDSRNNITHAPLFSWQGGDVVPSPAWGNRRAQKLMEKDLLAEYTRIRDVLRALRDYAVALHDPLGSSALPLPDRPRLQSDRGPRRSRSRRPQAPATAPSPQPRSSRE